MKFVKDVPQGLVVGQTHVHDASLSTQNKNLEGFNLALHVNDDPQRVQQHRMALMKTLNVQQMTWLMQTHSTICHVVNDVPYLDAIEGDALVTSKKSHALMMMTADCLPIVLSNEQGTEVANLHAGWRGLANGIIESTLGKMKTSATWAWLGACIAQPCFEVGAEVKEVFCRQYAVEHAFKLKQNNKYDADLYAIARHILILHGVGTVCGGDECTYSQKDYFSYRENAKTGRMATFVFMR